MPLITGSLTKITATDGIDLPVKFKSLSTPLLSGGEVITGGATIVRSDGSGDFSVTLAPGDYEVTINARDVMKITVPATSGPFEIDDLVTSGAYYDPEAPVGSGAVDSVAGKTGVVTLVAADISNTTTTGRALMTATDAAAGRTALGLGTAATSASTAFEASGAVSTHAAVTSGVHGISSFGASLVASSNATAAKTILEITGTGSVASTDITDSTATGRALLTAANAAAGRTTLGLGTAATSATGDFEASGAVATHATLTSSVHGISSFGASLVDDADASTARTTLGLGTAATQASSAFESSGAVSTHAAVTSGVHGISSFGASLIDDADASAARTTLGLGTSSTQASTVFAQVANNLSDLANAGTARTNLGLGSISTQAASNVAITGGTISGATITGSASDNVLKAGDTMTGLLAFSGTTHVGIRLNNLTTTQRDAISSPAAGSMIWNTTTSRNNIYNGSAWTAGWVKLEGDTMTGPLAISQGTITANAPLLDASVTFNNAGVTFTAAKINVTDTASAAASMLIDLQVASSSKFKVTKGGVLTVTDIGALSAGVNNVFASYLRTQSVNAALWDQGYGGGPPGLRMASTSGISWTSTAFDYDNSDLVLVRDAANVLAQRNGTNAQSFRWYRGWTSNTNYSARGTLQTQSDGIEIAAESAGATAIANLDIRLTPLGTGAVRFGTHSAIGAETITGYITIKDSGGTTRKIAVVS